MFQVWRSVALRPSHSTLLLRIPKRGILTTSFTKGPEEPPLLNTTINDHFKSIVSQFGDRDAIVSRHQRKRLSYEELDRESTALARGLESLGVVRGDRVAVSLGNSIEYAVITYALFKMGAILVPLNPAFTPDQVASALRHIGASVLFTGMETNLPRKPSRSNERLLRSLVSNLEAKDIASTVAPSLRSVVVVANSHGRANFSAFKCLTSYADILERGGDSSTASESHQLSPTDVINIQFTSGTTSSPKAACLTHLSILNNGKSIGDRMRLTENDVVCCPPPLFHCFGSVLGYMATATHGASIVFPAEAFDPLATLRAVQEEKATALYGVPTMFLDCLELIQSGQIKNEGFEHLRTGIAAGSSIPAELMRKLHKVLNLKELTICYGMTETSPVSAMTTTDDPLDRRIDSVGRLLPHVEAKVVSTSNPNEILPPNTHGELAVSGYLLMKEYWRDPERTAEVMIPEGGKVWMHTGDEATISPEGYVRITGRLKDLIIRGGENIAPLEIENRLLAHDGVAEASVVGVKDERYGEEVAAFVVRRTDTLKEVECKDWVGAELSRHLVPRYVFFIKPVDIPKTASGKIMKYKLREMAEELVNNERTGRKATAKGKE